MVLLSDCIYLVGFTDEEATPCVYLKREAEIGRHISDRERSSLSNRICAHGRVIFVNKTSHSPEVSSRGKMEKRVNHCGKRVDQGLGLC